MSESKEVLRSLNVEDIPAAFWLSAQAGWNQTEEDWRTLLDLAPSTCFGIEVGGELASTTTMICYGRRLGWIGMVLTKSDFKRRGLARKLLQHTLNVADQMGMETLKLDATDQGQPLYIQYGFRGEHTVERWFRAGGETKQLPTRARSSTLREHDPTYFGADRSPLFERLIQRNYSLVRNRAYLFARPGRVCAYMGPCVSNNPEDARNLTSTCVQETLGNWFWDLFPDNHDAVAIAHDLDFTPQRHLLRMGRGKELTQNIGATYAIAGFELG